MAIEGKMLATVTIREDLTTEQHTAIRDAILAGLKDIWPNAQSQSEGAAGETTIYVYVPN